jgi:hypothetical protein
MVIQVKALLDMARALPRPRVLGPSPVSRLARGEPYGRSPASPGHLYNNVVRTPLALNPPALSRQPESAGSQPFDERLDNRPLNRLTTPRKGVFRTPPRANNAAVVTPDSPFTDASAYNESPLQARHASAFLPSQPVDNGADGKLATKTFLAPHFVPGSPAQAVDFVGIRSSFSGESARGLDKEATALSRLDPSRHQSDKLQAVLVKDTPSGTTFRGSDYHRNGPKRVLRSENIIVTTGNAERDNLMNRAKELLDNYRLFASDDY